MNTAEKFSQSDSFSTLSNERERIYKRLFARVGSTPLHRITAIHIPNNNRIWAKEEQIGNPTESAFDRVYPGLFKLLEERGCIVPGITPVIECSVGNAGASFAFAARELGYKATVITNADTPRARIEQIKSYGAEILFSPSLEYGGGYIKVLNSVLEEDRKTKKGKIGQNTERLYAVTKIMPEARMFYRALAAEACDQLNSATANKATFSYFVSAVGSGDLMCGVSAYMKQLNSSFQSIAIEPEEMRTLSGLRDGNPLSSQPVSVQELMIGVTAPGVTLDRLSVDFSLIDDIVPVSIAEWKAADAMLLNQEGKTVGRTSAGALAGALKVCQNISNQDILTVFYDARWKYGDVYPTAAVSNS